MDGRFVSYLRVSTTGQGQSGLGLEAQRKIVTDYLNGGSWDLLAEYVEIESGKNCNRRKLAEALAHCRRTGATLLIAKLDRLARNVAFTANLMESGVNFVACDIPNAKPFELHIRASLAEEEARMISERTRQALQAAKARGKVLGGFRGHRPDAASSDHARAAAIAAADRRAAELAPLVREMRGSGASLAQIAGKLTSDGIRTARGGQWTATAVSNVLKRLEQVA